MLVGMQVMIFSATFDFPPGYLRMLFSIFIDFLYGVLRKLFLFLS
jgi:hypothetical protein